MKVSVNRSLILVPTDSTGLAAVLPYLWQMKNGKPGFEYHVHFMAWEIGETLRGDRETLEILSLLEATITDGIDSLRRFRWARPFLRGLRPASVWDRTRGRGLRRQIERIVNVTRAFLRHAFVYFKTSEIELLTSGGYGELILVGPAEMFPMRLVRAAQAMGTSVVVLADSPLSRFVSHKSLNVVPNYPCEPVEFPDLQPEWFHFVGRAQRARVSKGGPRLLVMWWDFRGGTSGRGDLEENLLVRDSSLVIDWQAIALVARTIGRVLTDSEVEVWVKPHPHNNLRTFRAMLHDFDLGHSRIVRSSVHALSLNVDGVIALFDPECIVAVAAGLPVVHLGCGLVPLMEPQFSDRIGASFEHISHLDGPTIERGLLSLLDAVAARSSNPS